MKHKLITFFLITVIVVCTGCGEEKHVVDGKNRPGMSAKDRADKMGLN
jgi:hypothetical protein